MSTKKTTNETSTLTPSNPQWVDSGAQTFADKGTDLLGQDPTKFVAGPQSLNTSLFGLAGGLGTQGADYLNQAGGLLNHYTGAPANLASFNPAAAASAGAAGYNPATATAAQIGPTALAQGQTAFGGIGNYTNPYQSQVVNQTLSDLNRARTMADTSDGRDALLAGQFGGSRQGVADQQNYRDYIDRAGAAAGQLNLQGFNTALSASQSDADRAQQANLTNAGAVNTQNLNQAQLGQQAGLTNRDSLNNAWQFNAGNAQQSGLFNAGNQQQTSLANSAAQNQNGEFNAGQQDTGLQRLFQGAGMFNTLGQTGLGALGGAAGAQQDIAQSQAGAPLSTYGALSGDFSGLPLGLFHGGTTTGTGTETTSGLGNAMNVWANWMNSAAKAAAAGGG